MEKNPVRDARKIVGVRGDIQITNQEAYNEFIELSNDPLLNEKKFITVSDGRTLNLAYPKVLQQVKELPEREQAQIKVRKKIYDKKHMRRNHMYMRAYGTHVSFDGVQKKKGVQSPLMQRKNEIIELFGRMFTPHEIHKVCLEDWDLKVSIASLSNFRDINKHIILQKIEEYKRTYDNVRLGHKRPRLEELTWLYAKRKTKYETSMKVEDHRLLLQTLEQIRKEVEGDTLRIDGNMNHNLELTIKTQIEGELMKNMLVKEIIISRVASRLGLDPMKMLHSIKNSYHRNRLDGVEDIAHEEIVYPSSETYDFNKIEAINQQREIIEEKDKKKFQAEQIPTPEVITTSNRIKEALIAKLTGKKEAVLRIKNSAFFNSIKQDTKWDSQSQE